MPKSKMEIEKIISDFSVREYELKERDVKVIVGSEFNELAQVILQWHSSELIRELEMLMSKAYGIAFREPVIDIREIQQAIDKIKGGVMKWLKPKLKDAYFYISDDGKIKKWFWTGMLTEQCKFGNCFKTKDEALQAASKIRRILKEGK